jgi:fatty acid desaturase
MTVEATIPVRTNLALAAMLLALAAILLFVAPALGWYDGVGGVLLLTLAVVATPLHWGLIHEGIHGNLAPDATQNRTLSRLLSVPLLVPFEVVRFGHLTHHGFNRNPLDRPEAVDGEPGAEPDPIDRIKFYAHLLFGTSAIELSVPWLFLLPRAGIGWSIGKIYGLDDPQVKRIRKMAETTFLDPERIARIRVDLALTVAMVVASLYCAGDAWGWVAAALLLRGVTISVLDNAPHYGTPVDSGQDATNSRAPAFLRALLLNSNFHGIHHARPNLPWSALPQTFVAMGARYGAAWLAMVLRQFRGPVSAEQLQR